MISESHEPEPQKYQTITGYIEMMDAAAAETQQLCDAQPEQQAVRTALLRAEKTIHQAGWDAPPELFLLYRHTKTGRVRYDRHDVFTRIIINAPMRSADVLDGIALAVEFVRAQAMGSARSPVVDDAPPFIRQYLRRARMNPRGDLFGGGDLRWRFFGIGFVSEAWIVLNMDDTTQEAARSHTIYRHPNRIEMRQLYLAARDGWNWEVRRLRRTSTIAVPRHCIATNHDSNTRVVGSIPHALTRMCNAIASNSVPVMPDDAN